MALLAGGAVQGDAYAAGRECFEQLDFACAEELLSAAAREADPADRLKLEEIYRKLAESRLALGKKQEAVDAFAELLRLYPDYRLDPQATSPKIVEAFERASAIARERAAPPPLEKPPPPARAYLHLDAGAHFLVGNDAELLRTGGAFELVAEFPAGSVWQTAAGLRYAFHRTEQGSTTLHIAGGFGGGGAAFCFGDFRLALFGGAGLAYFGVIEEDGKAALWLPFFATLDWRIGSVVLGVAASPGWLMTLESEPLCSFTFSAGLRVGLAL